MYIKFKHTNTEFHFATFTINIVPINIYLGHNIVIPNINVLIACDPTPPTGFERYESSLKLTCL